MAVKRLYRRFAVALDTEADVRLEDVSLTGMRVLSQNALKLEESFQTAIRTEKGPLPVRGRIVRACLSRHPDFRYEYGATIIPEGEEGDARLAEFIQSLGSASQPLPEAPGSDDVQQLERRIRGLEADLADLSERHQKVLFERDHLAKEMEKRLPGGFDESKLLTRFPARRFRHLAKIGQPFLRLVPEPTSGIKGRRFQLLGRVLIGETFDLPTLAGELQGKMTPLAVAETLWDLYEEERIDFA